MAAWEHDGQHDTYRHAMLWCFLTHLTAIYNVFAMSLQCLCNVFACHMFQVQRVPWIFHVCFALLTFWGSKKSAVCSITGWMPSTARSLGIDLYDETSAVPQSFGGETEKREKKTAVLRQTRQAQVRHVKHKTLSVASRWSCLAETTVVRRWQRLQRDKMLKNENKIWPDTDIEGEKKKKKKARVLVNELYFHLLQSISFVEDANRSYR